MSVSSLFVDIFIQIRFVIRIRVFSRGKRMKREASFDDLIQAIQDAFIKVNNMSEAQHLQKISEYFNEDYTPKVFKVMYPYFDASGNVNYRETEIPQICLLPMSSLKLDEVEVDFKVQIYGGVKLTHYKESDASDDNPALLKAAKKSTYDKNQTFIGYFPQGNARHSKDDNFASIRLKFTSDDPPEGLMRIQEQYTKISL
jgi:hypothetical protein